MKNLKNTKVSMIVPSYMAEDYVYDNLLELHSILSKSVKFFEIICVVDGSPDNTLKNAKKVAKNQKKIKIYAYQENKGKGYAVRYGVKKALGEIIGFIDAGKDLVYEDLLKLFEVMDKSKADIVIGSKRHSKSKVNYPIFRKLYSYGYQFYVKSLFNLSVGDTQVGMKIFKNGIIKKVLPALTIDDFAFDIEILSITEKLLGAKIKESPIHVNLDENSSTIKIKGGFIKNSIMVFCDTLEIFYKLNISGFYKRKLCNK